MAAELKTTFASHYVSLSLFPEQILDLLKQQMLRAGDLDAARQLAGGELREGQRLVALAEGRQHGQGAIGGGRFAFSRSAEEIKISQRVVRALRAAGALCLVAFGPTSTSTSPAPHP